MRPDQTARPFEIRWIGGGEFLEDRDRLVVAPDGVSGPPGGVKEICQIVNDAGIVRVVGTEAGLHRLG
jgi:hypothetical protein